MKNSLAVMLFLPLALALAQEAPPTPLPKFQEFVSPADERVKVFMEIEAKAEAGDTKSLEELGEYFYDGQFPVIQNQQKAREVWMSGARLGSAGCARRIQWSYPDDPNNSEVLIEKARWGIIQTQLAFKGRFKYGKPDNLSDSSFQEAQRRAEEFLTSVKAAPDQSVLEDFKVPSPWSVKEAQAFRMKLLTEFRKVQSPLYLKVSMASPAEVSSYTLIARKLEMIQKRGLSSFSSGSGSSGSQGQHKEAKIKEIQAQLSAFKIKTTPPFTRQDLNQAQTFLDRYRDLLDTIEKGL